MNSGLRISWPFGPLAALAASAVLLAGCRPQHTQPAAEPPLPTVRVHTMTLEARPTTATEEVVGTVRARLRASLEAKVSGRIAQMPVVAGQTVKKGELIARLEVLEIAAKLEQARATAEQTARDEQRFASLRDQKAITPAEYEAVESRNRIAKAAVTEAETMLGYATVTAPFDGVVTRKQADLGDLASPGRAIIELEDPSSLRLEADVSEGLLSRVALGAKLPVLIAAVSQPLEGTVSEVAPAADPNSRTFRVKLDLPAVPGVRLGQFGRVAVPVGESLALQAPASAIVVRGQMELVFVVAEGKARMRIVKTGKRSGDQVELVSGVNAGEQLVVTGATPLRDGQPVEVGP